MTIAEALKLPAGEIIDHVFGRLISVGPYENRTRPDGQDYTAQVFTLSDKDESGRLLGGTMYDHYPLDDYKHQVLYFCSMKSRNGRFGGVISAKLEQGGIFNRKPAETVIRVSKAGAIHTVDSFKLLKRKHNNET